MKTPTIYVPGSARYPRILLYHEISPQFQLGITAIAPQRFLGHLEFLKNSGLSLVPLRGLSQQAPENSVCLTFDDGYASFYEQVFPIIAERKIPATLFVIAAYVGDINDWDLTFGINRRKHLTWEQIQEISAAGVDIGSHTQTHRSLTRLPLAEVRNELEASRKALEDHLGKAVSALALPFGEVNLEIFSIAREMGYQEICGGAPGLHGFFAGVLPRMPVYRWDGRSALRRKLALTLWERFRLLLLQNCSRGTRLLKT